MPTACLIGILASAAHGAVQLRGAVTAFVHVNVIPMDRERVLPDQTVLVQGGRITALGAAAQVRIPAGARRVDGRGKFLLPGLADMHFHLGVYDTANTELVLFLLLANGVTTIRNLDYQHKGTGLLPLQMGGADMLRLRARVAAGELLGPRIYTSGEWRAHPEQSVQQNLVAYKAAGYDFLKIHDESRATIDSLIPVARRLGIRLLGHPSGGLDQALAAPFASVEHFRGYEETRDTAAITAIAIATKRAGVWNCPTLVNEEWDGNPDSALAKLRLGREYLPENLLRPWSYTYQKRNAIVEPTFRRRLARTLQDVGAGLLLGTDGFGWAPPGYFVHLELEALVQAGLTPYQALLAGTRNVAEFFGILDSAGTVAVGKRADLVLLYGNPLVNVRHTTLSAGVMVAGRWLSKDEIDRHLARYIIAPP